LRFVYIRVLIQHCQRFVNTAVHFVRVILTF